MPRKATQFRAVDQILWWIPNRPVLIQVKLLQRGRHDQIAPPSQNAGALRSAQTLTTTEGDQVSASVDKASQIGSWRQLSSRVDDQRHASVPAQRRNFLHRWCALWIREVRHGDGAL